MSGKQVHYTIPSEWAPHQAIWTAWPSHADLWEEDLEGARSEVAAMIQALSAGDAMKVLACGEEAIASARRAVGQVAEIFPATFGDIWLRDTGPIFTVSTEGVMALRFRNNGWGGKYTLPGDDTVGDVVVQLAGVKALKFDFVLEGGALEHNGAGTILTTRQCLLNSNRNSGWDQARAEQMLANAFSCNRILWLEDGLHNDHTDGHIDNLARFIAEKEIVCQEPSGADDPNAQLYASIVEQLQTMSLTVHVVPSPGKVVNADGDIMPASHMNFIIGNDTVVVPVYNEEYGNAAVRALQKLIPDRRVVGVMSTHLLTGGGSFHCITQQWPAI